MKQAAMARVGMAMLAFAIAGPHAAQAVTYTWTQTAGGAQSWNTAANWSPAVVPSPVSGDTMNFVVGLSANTTLTQEADRTAEDWNFQDTTGPGSNTWTINSGNLLILAGATPTINVVNGSVTLNNVLAGNQGMTKSGGGSLVLANAGNTLSGGITVNAGTLDVRSAGAYGDIGNVITFAGNSSITSNNVNFTTAQSFVVNNGVNVNWSIGSNNSDQIVNGTLSGNGTITVGGTKGVRFLNTGNTFTGAIVMGSGIFSGSFETNSLGDAPGAGAIRLGTGAPGNNYGRADFLWGAGALSGLTINNRIFDLGQNGGISNLNADLNKTIIVNTDLGSAGNTSPDVKTLFLGGINTGNNEFAGLIADVGGVVKITKEGNGKWLLSDANTHSGATTLSAGTLGLANVNAIQNSTLDTGASSGTKQVTFNVAGTNTYNIGGLTGTDALAIGTNTLSIGANGASTTYSGNISGTGGLTKVGAGTLTLAALNGYSGVTSIQDGILALGAAGSISSSSSVVIGVGGEFDTTALSFTMLGSQPFTWDIDPAGAGTAGLLDASILDIAAGNASFNALATLDDAFYIVANYTSLNGTFATSSTPAGYVLDYNFNGLNQIALVQNANIPEPATATLAALGLGGLLMRRRRMA